MIITNEPNSIHDAYSLLMGKYMPQPTMEELTNLGGLFKDWSISSNQSVLSHLFEIIESHESHEIVTLAIDFNLSSESAGQL